MNQKPSDSAKSHLKTKIKVVFLGQQSTGKTSILSRFIHDRFQQTVGPTVGIDFMAKNLHIGQCTLRMQLWDTAGQERFRSLVPNYLKDALIAFIVFDLTNAKSFGNINEWIDMCNNNRKQKTILVVLGNKADLTQDREVEHQTIRSKIQATALPYFQVSAKTGLNIKEAFLFAGNQYYNSQTGSDSLVTAVFGDKTELQQIRGVNQTQNSGIDNFKSKKSLLKSFSSHQMKNNSQQMQKQKKRIKQQSQSQTKQELVKLTKKPQSSKKKCC